MTFLTTQYFKGIWGLFCFFEYLKVYKLEKKFFSLFNIYCLPPVLSALQNWPLGYYLEWKTVQSFTVYDKCDVNYTKDML